MITYPKGIGPIECRTPDSLASPRADLNGLMLLLSARAGVGQYQNTLFRK